MDLFTTGPESLVMFTKFAQQELLVVVQWRNLVAKDNTLQYGRHGLDDFLNSFSVKI